jgi:hypothetical protein
MLPSDILILVRSGMLAEVTYTMQVYDITLDAALRAQSCGPNQLMVTGEWHWLLSQYANAYGIREFYARLSHLRWILRYGALTRKGDCEILPEFTLSY